MSNVGDDVTRTPSKLRRAVKAVRTLANAFSSSTGTPMHKSYKGKRHTGRHLWRVGILCVRFVIRLQALNRAEFSSKHSDTRRLTTAENRAIEVAWLRATSSEAEIDDLRSVRGVAAFLRRCGIQTTSESKLVPRTLELARYREGTIVPLDLVRFIASKVKQEAFESRSGAADVANEDLYRAVADFALSRTALPDVTAEMLDMLVSSVVNGDDRSATTHSAGHSPSSAMHSYLAPDVSSRRFALRCIDSTALLSPAEFGNVVNGALNAVEHEVDQAPAWGATSTLFPAKADVLPSSSLQARQAAAAAAASDFDPIDGGSDSPRSRSVLGNISLTATPNPLSRMSPRYKRRSQRVDSTVSSASSANGIPTTAVERAAALLAVQLRDVAQLPAPSHPILAAYCAEERTSTAAASSPSTSRDKYTASAFPELRDRLGRPRQYTVEEVNSRVDALRAREALERPPFGVETVEGDASHVTSSWLASTLRKRRPPRRQPLSRGIHYCVRSIPNSPDAALNSKGVAPTLQRSASAAPSSYATSVERSNFSRPPSRKEVPPESVIPRPSSVGFNRAQTPSIHRPPLQDAQRADGGVKARLLHHGGKLTGVRDISGVPREAWANGGSLLHLGIAAARASPAPRVAERAATPAPSTTPLGRIAALALRCFTPTHVQHNTQDATKLAPQPSWSRPGDHL